MALECTVIIIAHRIDTVGGCDSVVVLEGGKMVQIGAPNDVVGKSLQRDGSKGRKLGKELKVDRCFVIAHNVPVRKAVNIVGGGTRSEWFRGGGGR